MKTPSNITINIEILTRYLAGEATPDEAMAVDDWRMVAAENATFFAQLSRAWHAAGESNYQPPDIAARWQQFIQDPAITERPLRKRPFLVYKMTAAIVLIALLAAGVLIFDKGITPAPPSLVALPTIDTVARVSAVPLRPVPRNRKAANRQAALPPAQNTPADLPEDTGYTPAPPARHQVSIALPDRGQQQAIMAAAQDARIHLIPVYALQVPHISARTGLLHTPVPASLSVKSISLFPRKRKENVSAFYAAAGITTDEIWRISPVVQAGVPWLYAVGSWSTNFRQHAWSYGLGSSLKLSDKWKLHLAVTTGSLEKIYPYLTDTLKYNVVAEGHLHRGMLTLEKQLNARYSIRFGPVMNILKSSYYFDVLSGIPPTNGMGIRWEAERYPLLKVPYTLSNTYSPSSPSATKTWIGLQVSIFYRPDFFNRKQGR